MTKYYQTYSEEPAFIDFLAVDMVVSEHRWMNLTSGEKRYAAHRLYKQGLTGEQISRILRVTQRSAERMLAQPPPPALDVDEDGNIVDSEGQCVDIVR